MSTRVGVSRAVHAAPWFVILCLIAIVQLVRGMPLDAGVFAVAAALVAFDAVRTPAARRARPALDVRAVLAGGVVVAVVLVLVPRHGWLAGIVLGVLGLATMVWAWLRPPSRSAEGDESVAARRVRVRRAAIGWAIVLVTACVIELVSFLLGRLTVQTKLDHPALSELLDPLLDAPLGRTVFVVLWLGIGVLLLTRGRGSDA